MDIKDLSSEDQLKLRKFQQQLAIYKAFVLPFRKLYHGTKLLLSGLLGLALMPFYLGLMVGAAAFGFLLAGGWLIVIPVGAGIALAYYLPYGNVANTAIAAAWAVGLFGLGQLLVASTRSRDDG